MIGNCVYVVLLSLACLELSYKSSTLCDVEYDLCHSVRVVAVHLSRCELSVVRIDVMV
jgi:hypothetical protein